MTAGPTELWILFYNSIIFSVVLELNLLNLHPVVTEVLLCLIPQNMSL